MKKILLTALLMLGLIGCVNTSAPDCSDAGSKDLVLEIASGSLSKMLTKGRLYFKDLATGFGLTFHDNRFDEIELSLQDIRVVKINEKLGSFQCEAILKATFEEQSESVPISYTSELANGGDDFYIQVYDLTKNEEGSLLSVLMTKGTK